MAALQQISQMRCLTLGINTLGNVQLVATCKKLILSDLQHTSMAMLDCFKKQTVFPPKTLPSSSRVLLVSRAACVSPRLLSPGAGPRSSDLLPQPVPSLHRHSLPLHTANLRLRRCPVVLARLLLSFSSSHLCPVSRAGEGSWELLAAAALVQGMPSTAAGSGDLTCQRNVPPQPTCEVRALLS